MNPSELDARKEQLFQRLVGLPRSQQIVVLAHECRNDPDLRVEVEHLLLAGPHASKADALPDRAGPKIVWQSESGDTDKSAEPEATAVFPTSVASTPRAGLPEYIGKYRILGVLGSGGQATTFLVRDPDLDCRVVLKQYHSAGLEAEYYLRIEARSLARIHSPFVARCLHVERIDGKLYLIMEYVPGVRLNDYARRESANLVRIAELLRDIAQGLLDVHGAGLLHRDIKPANILVRPNGTPCLVDFGFAAALGSEAMDKCAGTRAYMSPEQAREETLTPSSDVFGLGTVMFELLTGQPPYSGAEALEQAKRADFRPPTELNPAIPQQLQTICLKAMARDPAQRYATAETLRNDLQTYLDELSSAAKPERKPSHETAASAPAEIGLNPYKGLSAFTEADADWFFGRDAQIERLWRAFAELHAVESDHDRRPRVLPIIGPSGSGKSSLARAGLVAKLKRHPLPNRENARYVTFTPASRPLETLAIELARIATGEAAPAAKAVEFERLMRDSDDKQACHGLRRIAALLPEVSVSPLVLLIDQFEEVFSLCPDAVERRLFIDNLLTAASDRVQHISVIFTLRSDFLGETQDHQGLNLAISETGLIVPAMMNEELHDSIARPAERAGHVLDGGTIELLVADTRDREGTLPLLQFALARIWEGLRIGHAPAETLRRIGGVGGALAGEAQRIYESLPEQEQPIARRAFLAMVQLGEGTKDTRRRARLADLVTGGDDLRKVRAVLSRFAEPGARLVTLSADHGGTGTTQSDVVEVTHEALFEHWQSLRQWIDRSRDDIRFHRRLEEAANRWQENQRPRGMLWRTPDLDLVRKLYARAPADFTVLENEFRLASERLVRRERLTKIAALSAICVAFVVASIFWRLAERSRNVAEIAERKALSLASISAAETGVLRLRGSIAESNFDPFGLLHLARARINAEGDADAVVTTSQLWSSWRDDLGNRLVQVVGHEGPVVDVAIHPGGKLFATASLDKTGAVWDVTTGKPLVEGGLKHAAPVGLVSFSPDGKWLATASYDGAVRLWSDASHYKQSVELHASPGANAHGDRVQAIAFSPSAELLATGSRDGQLRLWSVQTGQLVHLFDGVSGQVSSVTFDANGTSLAALSAEESSATRLRVWTRESSEKEWQVQGVDRQWASGLAVGQISTKYGVAFRPGRSGAAPAIAVHGSQAEFCSRDSKGRNRDEEIFSHGNIVWAVRFSPDGQLAASAGADNVSEIIQTANTLRRPAVEFVPPRPEPLSFSNGPARVVHDGDVRAVAFSPDSRMLATASWDQTVRLYDVSLSEQRLVQRGRPLQHFGKLWAAEFTPNGKYLVTASDDGMARVWDCEPELGVHLVHDATVNGHVISPDGKLISTYSDDKTARLWRVPQGEPVCAPLVHRSPVTHAAWDSNSRVLATASKDGTISIWDTNGRILNEFRSDEREPASHVRFVAPQRLLAVAIARVPIQNTLTRGTMRIWEIVNPTAKTGECRLLSSASKDYLPQDHFARAFAFDAEGSRIARVDGKDVLVCSLDSNMTEGARFSHENLVIGAVFHPAGRFLLSGGWDGAGRVWDLQRKIAAAPALDHGKGVLALALSGNGRVFVTGCEDKFVRVWSTDTWQLVCPPLRHPSLIGDVAVNFDGGTVAARTGHSITIWQSATGHPLREMQISTLAGRASLQLTPNADSLAAILNDHTSLLLAFGAAPHDAAEMEMETQLLLGAELDSTGRTVSPVPWRAWQSLRDRFAALSPSRSVSLAPSERMHRSRGAFFLYRADWQAAAWHFSQILDKQPGDIDARLNRALAYKQGGQYEPALADLGLLLHERPDHVDALRLQADCRKRLKQWEAAAESLEQLAKIARPVSHAERIAIAYDLFEVASHLVETADSDKAPALYRIAETLSTADDRIDGSATSATVLSMHVAQVRASAGLVRCLLNSHEPNSDESDQEARKASTALQKLTGEARADRWMELANDPNVAYLAEHDENFRAVWSQPQIQQEISARRLVESLRKQSMDMTLVHSLIPLQTNLSSDIRKRAQELARDPKLRATEPEILNTARRQALTRDLPVADYESAARWLTRLRASNSIATEFHRQAILGMLAYRAGKYSEAERLLSQAIQFAPERAWLPVYSAFAAMAAARQGKPASNDEFMTELSFDYKPPTDADLVESISGELAEVTAEPSGSSLPQ